MANNYKLNLERAQARFHSTLADVHAELANLHTHAGDPTYNDWDDALNVAADELRAAEYSIIKAARVLREGC